MTASQPYVTLVPIDEDNVGLVFDLDVAPEQRQFVAPNPWSLAQALAQLPIAWPRAIVSDGEVAGFLMLEIDPEEENGRPFWLWRLMVADGLQGQGIGSAALAVAIEEVKRQGGIELYTSWVEAPGGPEPFYRKLGFVPTGEIDDGEVVARLGL
jgi:diamine N-acetyltransferase